MKRIIALTIILSAFIFGCKHKSDQTATETRDTIHAEITNEGFIKFTKEQAEVADIKTDTLKKIKMSIIIPATGIVEATPGNKISVSIPMEGYVKKIFIKHGVSVKKGSPLMEIENFEFIDLQANYLKLKSQLAFLEQELKRQRELYEQNAIPIKNLQKIESEYNSTLAEFKAIEHKLRILGFEPEKINNQNIKSTITIYSPISGVVGEVFVNIGEYVEPKDVLVEITNPSGYSIMLDVYSKYFPLVKIGQTVIFQLTGYPDTMYAQIYSINPVLDPETKTFKVHALPQNVKVNLPEGAYVSAKILAKNLEVFAVPKIAVVSFGQDKYVYVEVEPYTYKPVKVETGRENNKYVEILNYQDLLGEKIVISGANYIKAKQEFLNE